ncbi:MAG: universal stress protein, partial [Methanobrevibacter sp.]|nr:universal stress protein [Methanobrevibacter sp.]
MFKNILVASDGSKCGEKAVDLAIDMAAKYGAKISALYVMDFDSDLSYDELDD